MFCGLPPPVSRRVTSAFRDPFNCGVKVTLIVQVPFAGSVEGLMGQLLVSEKLVTREPVIDILEIDTEELPMFVTMMFCGGLDVPLARVPKFRLVGEKLITVPVPVRVAVWGLLGALSETVTVPVNAPALLGTKTTLMVQLPLAARLLGQLLVWVNGPVVATLVMVAALVPVLVSVAGCELLLVPTS